MARFSWLHFSDLQMGPRGSPLLRPEYRDSFERDLRRLHERVGPWDVVFISGDLTRTGTAREFDLLNSTLSSLWDYFRSLGSDPCLLAVPGPHDFWRNHPAWGRELNVLYPVFEIKKALRSTEKSKIEQRIRGGLSPFATWFDRWRAAHTSPVLQAFRQGLFPGDFSATLITQGLKIGVIGLNSIFREEGPSLNLSPLDLELVEAAAGMAARTWASQHNLNLLLTHRTPPLLKPERLAQIQESLSPRGHLFLHLCGIAECPWVGRLRWPYAIQAPSLLGELSIPRTPTEYWGYAAGHLELSQQDSQFRLFPRSVSPGEHGLFGPDQKLAGGDALKIPLAALLKEALPLGEPSTLPPAHFSSPPVSAAAPRRQASAFRVVRDLPTPISLPPGVKLRETLLTGEDLVSCLAWAPSGDALVLGLSNGTLMYWSLEEEAPRWVAEAHATRILDLGFSPDGETLASRSRHHVRLWRPHGVEIKTAEPMTSDGVALAWASSGTLAAGTEHGVIQFWSAGTWEKRDDIWFRESSAPVRRMAWSPNGEMLAYVCDGDEQLSLWKVKARERILTAPPSNTDVPSMIFDIAWQPGSSVIAMSRADKTLHIWDVTLRASVAVLEGHTDAIMNVAFSFDGRFLASACLDGVIRGWRTDTWEQVAEIKTLRTPNFLAFSPTRHLAVTSERKGRDVRVWEFDTEALLHSRPPSATVHEISAKIVLVGEGRAGKSCLALRMVQDRYEEMDPTHGMRFWPMPSRTHSPDDGATRTRREIILWDMGGQSEYQLVHQLFLRDSAAALMVMEPGRGEQALHEIEGWNQRLLAQVGPRPLRKLLVGTQLDNAAVPADLPAIDRLVERCQFISYVPTSAKTGHGIPELKDALDLAIDWGAIEKVSRPELFQRLRQHIQQLREARRVVLTFSELERELRQQMGEDFDPEALRAVVGQLARQGLAADARMADGTRVLILEVEQVERYAGSLIITARDNPHGVPAIDVAKVLSPAMQFPRIRPEERLRRDQELAVLDCVIEMLLEHGLCLRHEGLLIFPTLFRPLPSEPGADFSHATSLHYDFSGPIDNIYASLVTSLAISRRFGPMRLWENRAEFGRASGDSSGVRRVKQGSQGARGYARLDVYFDTGTPTEARELFVNFIEEHLREHGVELLERLTVTCSCGRIFAEDVVRDRLQTGKADIICPVCEHRTPLTPGAQQARERNPELVKQVRALRTDIQELRSQSITETKASMTEARKVSPTQDTPIRILHLSDLHVGASEDPLRLLQPLAADLRDRYEGPGVERLDYLVITGDITNRAAPQEFDKARQFVSALIEQFELTSERCILVPGNHDLDWDTEVYLRRKKRQVDAGALVAGRYKEDGDGYYVRDEGRYPERFKNFSQHFYHPLTQKEYPLAPEEQCIPFSFTESGLQFLAMNSAWEIDEYFSERSSISSSALSRGLAAAEKEWLAAQKRGDLAEGAQPLRIALWHHPITGNEKIHDDAFLGRLAQAEVRLCLHGHIHEDRADLVNALHPTRKIHVVGAGSFGAPTHHRPESVPRLFNLLEVERDLRRIRVNTRCLRKQGGAWEGWAVWPGEKPGEKRAYYEITPP